MNVTTPLPVPQPRRDLPRDLPLVHEVQLRTAMAIQHLETTLTDRLDTAEKAASELKASAASLAKELRTAAASLTGEMKESREAFQDAIKAEAGRHAAALATLGHGMAVLAASVNRLAPGSAPVPEPGPCCEVFDRLFGAVESIVQRARNADDANGTLGAIVPLLLPFAQAKLYLSVMGSDRAGLLAGLDSLCSGSFVPQGGAWAAKAGEKLRGMRDQARAICDALAFGQAAGPGQQGATAPPTDPTTTP